MKLQVSKKEFKAVLKEINKVVDKKVSLPLLVNAKLVATEKEIFIQGGNVETSIEKNLSDLESVSVTEQGSVLFNPSEFAKLTTKLKGSVLTISGNENEVSISDSKATFTFETIDPENYPIFSKPSEQLFVAAKKEFFPKIKNVLHSISTQESRPVLTTSHFKLIDGNLEMVSTDSHRLSKQNMTVQGNNFEGNFRGKALKVLLEIDFDENVQVSENTNYYFFSDGKTTFSIEKYDGTYPDTDRLIPTMFNSKLTVNRKEILEMLDNAKTFLDMKSTERTPFVGLNCKEDRTELFATAGLKNKFSSMLTGQLENEEIDICFNPSYLMDCLKEFESEDITLNFVSSIRPITITSDKESLLELVTPVRKH